MHVPHAIELLNKKYADVFTILRSYPELENYLSPFVDAWESSAVEQLQGQIASAKIPLSRMISPALYWVMTGDDFRLTSTTRKSLKSWLSVTILTARISIRRHWDYIIPVES